MSSVGSISPDMSLPGFPTATSRGRDSTSHVVFSGLRQGQPKIVMTSASSGMGAALFPPGFPPSLLPLEGAPDVMNFLSWCSP
jgi:hypothetical protein